MDENNNAKKQTDSSLSQLSASDHSIQENSDQNINSSQKTTSIPIPPEAEDGDLIEKEWVERAKQIVAHTKHDPHEQQKALSLMKADYMKKRYNRDIKVFENDLKDLNPDSEE